MSGQAGSGYSPGSDGIEVDGAPIVLCDDNGAFLRTYHIDNTVGNVIVATDTDLDGVTPFVPVGLARVCGVADVDVETTLVCAAGVTLVRRVLYRISNGAEVAVQFLGANGAVVAAPAVYTQGACAATAGDARDVEVLVLCDNNGPFLRRTVFNAADGSVVSTTDTTLAGAAYAVVGNVGNCNADRETVCWTTTAGGTTIFTGTIRHDDRLTGPTTPGWALFNQNSTLVPATTPGLTFVQCSPSTVENPITVRSQHFNVVPGTPWTPAAAVGSILSVSYTVLSGTATVADHNGTSITLIPAGFAASWSVDEDQDVLTPPQSIASVGGRILVVWTER